MSEFSFRDRLRQRLGLYVAPAEEEVEIADIPTDPEVLVAIRNLKKHFLVAGGGLIFNRAPIFLKAVDGISFNVKKGETVGIVGESGCGKSTAARAILNLLEPTAGHVFFRKEDGEMVDLCVLDKTDLREMRRQIQIVFQDPSASLNPRMTAFDIIAEPLVIHKVADGDELKIRTIELMEKVGLMIHHAFRFPHEFSGGQKQRVGIARALALNPRFVILDEPVSALDVSVRAAVLMLLRDLQREFNLAYIFIAHDLSVIRMISDTVCVMYLGRLVEVGTVEEVFEDMRHPYTRALISAIPIPDPTVKPERIFLEGDPPSPVAPPPGCNFHPRCPIATSICTQEEPPRIQISETHFVECHHVTTK
ncbi:MAG TPA: oligopeptide/dipeptide ABC transporter ATP-binding protein [candidate division Zixibacteria bacterium]|nr:oligopeptide/dipeptide ABC transporter ATP-binding protein [candidate division Zixibacteria bacterium]